MINYETPETKQGAAYYEAGRAAGRTEMLAALKWLLIDESAPSVGTVFGLDCPNASVFEMPADKIIETVKEYRAAYDFRIGDVVETKSGSRYVVTGVIPSATGFVGVVVGINADGFLECEDATTVKRTGEVVESIPNVLRAIKEATE